MIDKIVILCEQLDMTRYKLVHGSHFNNVMLFGKLFYFALFIPLLNALQLSATARVDR